jgi:hypothetical protein
MQSSDSLVNREMGFRFPPGTVIFLFSTAYRPALVHSSACPMGTTGFELITRQHIAPMLKCVEPYLHSSIPLHGMVVD